MKHLFSLILSLVLIPTTAQADFDISWKLQECEAHLQANRLTTGRGGTALACYEEVLRQEPQNAEALKGLNEIAARYERWMNRASNRGQTSRAARYQKRLNRVKGVIQKWQEHGDDLQESKPKVFVQLGHSSGVNSVAFSPDGHYVLSGSGDTFKLWDASTGKEIRTFQGHSDAVNSVAFSPDGSKVLSGSRDKTLKLWNALTGREIRTFWGHSDTVESVTFSPDGSKVLSGSYDNTLKLWDLRGKEITTFRGHPQVNSVTFSPDGSKVLSGSSYGTVKLWNASTGKKIRTFRGHSAEIISVTFSPDGSKVLSGGYDNTLKLWNALTGKEIRTFRGHSWHVSSVAFSPDGSKVLSGSNDKTLKLWDLSGHEITTFRGHSESVWSVAFSPDGSKVLSGSYDNTLKLWDLRGKEITTFRGHSSAVTSVAFSPDGSKVLSGSDDKTFKLWELRGHKVTKFHGHSSAVTSVAFSPDGSKVLSGSKDDTLKLWDLRGNVITTFLGHSEYINSVFSPDGSKVLSGSWNDRLKLWDLRGNVITIFMGHSSYVTSVAFSPDGSKVLGSSDGTIQLWDLRGKEITFWRHSNVNSVAFSPDGSKVLSGSGWQDHTLKLWDTSTGREIRTFRGHSHRITSVAFSPDGSKVLSGSWDQTLKLWDTSTGKEIRTFREHSNYVSSVAFSPDGNKVLSGSWDGTIRLWNLKTGKEIAQMSSGEDGEWVIITPEGYYSSSLNGAKYINVRIGNKVYGIDQYEKIYHRPDIVKLAIQLGDSQKAIARLTRPVQMASVQPPALWFVSPTDGYETHKDSIEVQLKTENIADPAADVLFRINQRPLGRDRGKPVRPTSSGAKVRLYKKTIPLLAGHNWIEAEVRGKAGAVARRKILVVRKDVIKERPDLYYLGIGVANHPDKTLVLNYPDDDVIGLQKAFKAQEGRVYRKVHSKTLIDSQATRRNVIKSIKNFFKPAKLGDIAVLFISGHGVNTDTGYYFVNHDAEVDDLETTGVAWQIFKAVNDLKAHVILLADTCHSGSISGNDKLKEQAQVDPSQYLRDANLHNIIIFASSSGADYSMEHPDWGHGAFTKALIEGLEGKATLAGEDEIKLSTLQSYVRSRVRKLTDNFQNPTIPSFVGSGDFFELVLAKK